MENERIQGRLQALRSKMKEAGMDAYLVVSDDFHCSEYVGDFFKCREFISGFDGSAGSVLILQEEAGLWTDGRYFLQAEDQLRGTGITLFRMSDPGVPELEDYLAEKLSQGGTLGFDGRTLTSSSFQSLRKKLGDRVTLITDRDLVGEIWENRPAMSQEPVFELDVKYAGKSRLEKIEEVRTDLNKQKADVLILASLDDIAWLLNLRGGDVLYNPVFLSYFVIKQEEAFLYVGNSSVNNDVKDRLNKDGVSVRSYEAFYEELKQHTEGKRVLVDPHRINAAIMERIVEGAKILERPNPTLVPKARKNSVEIENVREAHRKDGVAVTRFIYWLKTHVGKERITEVTAAEKLEEFRCMGSHYHGQSFAPIAGYAEHGAIVHYEATEESAKELKPESFLLLDTGGQYLEGTTDITRTIALGPLTEEQKLHYTAVLKGNLKLGAAYFKHGCHGMNLDYLAREALWKLNLDYNHGTGHGVGYFLNVHEGPQRISNKEIGERENLTMEAGMITSNEPGLYLTGKYGIRIENLMVCVEAAKNEYGSFLCFDTLTLVPFEPEAICAELLTEEERKLLNQYHARVYETLAPSLSEEEKKWLAKVTAEV